MAESQYLHIRPEFLEAEVSRHQTQKFHLFEQSQKCAVPSPKAGQGRADRGPAAPYGMSGRGGGLRGGGAGGGARGTPHATEWRRWAQRAGGHGSASVGLLPSYAAGSGLRLFCGSAWWRSDRSSGEQERRCSSERIRVCELVNLNI